MLFELKASGLGLSGLIPDTTIGKLTQLQSLDLSNNKITALPSDLWSLGSLKSLNLSSNQISGNSELPVFGALDLFSNRLNGSLPDGFGAAFSKLKTVNLARNEIYGRDKDFAELKSLTSLNISGNLFKGSVIGVFQGQLEVMDLSKNQFQGHISQVQLNSTYNWSQLVYLDLSENQLSGEIFLNQSQAQNLRHLNLAYNRFARQKFPRIVMFLGLEYLNLSKTGLIGHIPGFSPETFETAFYGCPIAANPFLFKRRTYIHRVFKLALALTLCMFCLLAGLLFLAFGCRRKSRIRVVKQPSYKEEQNISGPFSFQTDSTTWVADVKQATSVPVVIFEKPLLNITFALLSATSNFDRGTLLAKGKFGPVYRGFLPGEIHVAVKVLVHGSTLTDQEAARELEYLGGIKHPNLVPLTGYCLAGDQRIAIYDYMENGNLQNLLHDLPLGVQAIEDWCTDTWEQDNNGIQNVGSEGLLTTWAFRHKIALGTARALAFLHHGCSPPIIHRDVKASSVYLDLNLEPILSDFGLAKIFGTGLEDEIARGSPGYVPPEFSQPQCDAPTPKFDVYCFGVVLFELITGKKPIGDDYPEDQEANLVSWVRGLVRKNQGSKAIDPKICDTGPDYQIEETLKIGYLCTADLPTKRPSMQQIVGLLKDIEPRAPH
ncbi:hypothetical protein CRYUN_Cryun33cG0096900 [Craigia yunnanensis]